MGLMSLKGYEMVCHSFELASNCFLISQPLIFSRVCYGAGMDGLLLNY